MTNDTDIKFLDALEDIKPEDLSAEAILIACRNLIMDYMPDATQADIVLLALGEEMRARYTTEDGGECMCPNCTATRKANAN